MSRIKAIVLGNSGSGKTGELISLASAGYRLWIMDYEDGADILENLIRHPPPNCQHWKKLTYSGPDNPEPGDINVVKISNTFKEFGGSLIAKSDGWERANEALASWKAERKTGDPYFAYTLTDRDVLVQDTLSGLADLCVDHVLALNSRAMDGKSGSGPRIQDYKQMQGLMDFMMRALACDRMRAHWILNCHVSTYQEGGETQYKLDNAGNQQKIQTGGRSVGFPKSTGETMSKSLGRHFNNVLFLDERPAIGGSERFLSTASKGIVRVKSQSPFGTERDYKIETGLADFFEDIRGKL